MEKKKCKMDTIKLIFVRRVEAKKKERIEMRREGRKYQPNDVPQLVTHDIVLQHVAVGKATKTAVRDRLKTSARG